MDKPVWTLKDLPYLLDLTEEAFSEGCRSLDVSWGRLHTLIGIAAEVKDDELLDEFSLLKEDYEDFWKRLNKVGGSLNKLMEKFPYTKTSEEK